MLVMHLRRQVAEGSRGVVEKRQTHDRSFANHTYYYKAANPGVAHFIETLLAQLNILLTSHRTNSQYAATLIHKLSKNPT